VGNRAWEIISPVYQGPIKVLIYRLVLTKKLLWSSSVTITCLSREPHCFLVTYLLFQPVQLALLEPGQRTSCGSVLDLLNLGLHLLQAAVHIGLLSVHAPAHMVCYYKKNLRHNTSNNHITHMLSTMSHAALML
jgi:hypothetical protein